MRPDRFRTATLQEVAHYGGTLPRGLKPPMMGGAAPLDKLLGASTAGATSSTTISVASAAASAIGEWVIVGAYSGWVPSTLSWSDAGGNTYVPYEGRESSGYQGGVGIAKLTTALAAAALVTASQSGSNSYMGISAASFTGLASGAATGGYASNFALSATNTASPSIATSASVNANDLVVAYVWNAANAGITFSGLGSWTALSSSNSTGTVAGYYLVPTVGGAVTFNPTASSAKTYGMAIIAFPAVTAPTNTVAPQVTGAAMVGNTLHSSTGSWS